MTGKPIAANNVPSSKPAGLATRDGIGPTVHVIDDDGPVRQALGLLLRSAGYTVVSHLSGLAFLEALPEKTGIGCILTDIKMPGLDGIDLVRRLQAMGIGCPIIVMTAHGDIATAIRAMKAGASDFIEKPFDDLVLLEMIATLLGGSGADQAGLRTEHPTAAHAEAADAANRISGLSSRERQVLDLLVAGKQNKMIAFELGISQRTAEIHRARLMARLGVRSLAEAVRLSLRAGSATEGPGNLPG